MKGLFPKGSLGRKVFVALIVGELGFAAVLGVTIGVFVALSDVQQRESAIREISSAIASGLMPMIADRQISHVEAQLSSLVQTADVHDVIGISVRDASGAVIASRALAERSAPDSASRVRGPLGLLLDEQVVEQPVIVDGLRVATVLVRFSPPGLSALGAPAIASMLVLLWLIMVSVSWTAFKLSAEVVEPLGELREFAARISEGELDARPVADSGGEIGELQQALSSMAQQIKDRDERLRGSYGELEEAYLSLEQAKNEIEDLSAVKSNFVAVAAHEIRGPLTTISLYSQLLREGELGTLGTAAEEAVDAVSSATTRLTTIVSDLMDSALLERGLLPITYDEVSLARLLEDAIRDSAMVASVREMKVEAVGDIPRLTVRADALRLRQVLDNLLSNAIKYSPEGSRVTVNVRLSVDSVVIEVADEGRGIPEGDDSQLFALFGRIDFGDSRDTAGLGLGLAISARIVEAHGGKIWYRANEAGVGSVFAVRLPLSGEQGEQQVTMIKVAEGMGSHE